MNCWDADAVPARAREPAFRAALAEHLGNHPEWEPVLFPERFTKAASAAR